MAVKADHAARVERDTQELLELFERHRLSPDKHEDVWKLLVVLFMELRRIRAWEKGAGGGAVSKKSKQSKGRKPVYAQDATMFSWVEIRRVCGDTRSEEDLIREIAQISGWQTPTIQTLWRRYQDLKDPSSRRSKRLARFFRAAIEAGEDLPLPLVRELNPSS